MDLNTLPEDPLARLAMYRRARKQADALAAAIAKYHAGEKLTAKEEVLVAYAPASEGGTGAGCRCGG